MLNPKEFIRRHFESEAMELRLIARERRHCPDFATTISTEMDRGSAWELFANNAQARIDFATVMAKELGEAAWSDACVPAPFFVTLAWSGHVLSLRRSKTFDVRRVIGAVHHALRGLDYVGMVEGGFCSRLDPTKFPGGKGVEWHAHAIVWGCTKAEMRTLIKELGGQQSKGPSGRLNAHCRPLTVGQVAGRARYMSKGQLKEYQHYPEWVHPETGEVRPAGRKPRDLRQGDTFRMLRVFEGRRMDQLAFAAGTGVRLLAKIRKAARWREHKAEAQEEARMSHWEREARRRRVTVRKRASPRRFGGNNLKL